MTASEKDKKLPSPKRGAIPTPKAEIERAKAYVPKPSRTPDEQSDKLTSEPSHQRQNIKSSGDQDG